MPSFVDRPPKLRLRTPSLSASSKMPACGCGRSRARPRVPLQWNRGESNRAATAQPTGMPRCLSRLSPSPGRMQHRGRRHIRHGVPHRPALLASGLPHTPYAVSSCQLALWRNGRFVASAFHACMRGVDARSHNHSEPCLSPPEARGTCCTLTRAGSPSPVASTLSSQTNNLLERYICDMALVCERALRHFRPSQV